jgi:hypothetical protein
VRYLNDLYPAVKAQVDKGATVEEAVKAVADQLEPKYGKDFANFRQGLGGPLGNVTKTYDALRGKK